jgi:glutathione S-transferase
MSGGQLILYHDWGSTCSQKVRLALAEKGLDYEGRVVRLRHFEHLQDDFLALNPDALVPVLLHDSFLVKESSVINEYLDAVFPSPPLQPTGARGRAEVGMWTRFIDHVTSPAIKKPSFAKNLVTHLQTFGVDAVDESTRRMPSLAVRDRWRSAARGGFTAAELEDAHADLRRTLVKMENALASTPWLAGDEHTLADIHAMPFIERIAVLPPYDLARDWPAVHAWQARMRARPAFALARFGGPPVATR